MTAGSYCYIGPQGIVHGTTLVLLNAGRKYLGIGKYTGAAETVSAADAGAAAAAETMAGRVYVSSGLGGMSGAQGKAGRTAGLISLIAEVDRAPLEKRHAQGWCGPRQKTCLRCLNCTLFQFPVLSTTRVSL